MKNINTFKQHVLNEKKSGIDNKDWDRMLNLVMSGKDGAATASAIKDKNKAIARFISGIKLQGDKTLNYNTQLKKYSGSFSEFGNTAIKLGATPEEIQSIFDETTVPSAYSTKITKLAGKKLNNRFVGFLSKAIIDAGYDIDYLPTDGYAITRDGKDAMSRNGIKWTIGYKTEINLDGKKVNLNFDAITDEGNGPTSYIIDTSGSNQIFNNFGQIMGKGRFITKVMNAIKSGK